MLSILIPTYNYNVYPLVKKLESQCLQTNIIFEIICVDDGSFSLLNEENQKINSHTNCLFIENKKNIGLSNNRNLLIDKAQYDYVLLIDADMLPEENSYISNYFERILKNQDVVFGGIKYFDNVPDNEYYLRWIYGQKHESKSVYNRNKEPYKSILNSNLLIKKSIVNDISFESSLKNYGYEDTLFAYNLKVKNISVKHINNPLIHNDKTTNKEYIEKTRLALNNLKLLFDNKLIEKKFVTIGFVYNLLLKFSIDKFFIILYSKIRFTLEKNLLSNRPSLTLFKIYKLAYFCYLNKK